MTAHCRRFYCFSAEFQLVHLKFVTRAEILLLISQFLAWTERGRDCSSTPFALFIILPFNDFDCLVCMFHACALVKQAQHRLVVTCMKLFLFGFLFYTGREEENIFNEYCCCCSPSQAVFSFNFKC